MPIRPSMNQPAHRRPSWAKTEASYRAHIIDTPSRHRPYNPDYGLENFSFDASHLAKFEMPAGLAQQLPEELRETATELVHAAAAVVTAIERLHGIEDEYFERAETVTAQRQLPPRRDSSQSTASVTAKTPAFTPPSSFQRAIAAPVAQSTRFVAVNPHNQVPTTMLGMFTPPWTPFDSQGPGTPSDPMNGFAGTVPDLQRVTAQLSPLSLQDSLTSSSTDTSTSTASSNIELMYVKKYNNELYDIKKEFDPRLKGLTRRINVLITEMENGRDTSKELRMTLKAFKHWFHVMKYDVSLYRDKISLLHEKTAGGGMAGA